MKEEHPNINAYVKTKKHLVHLIICGMSTAEKNNDLKSYLHCREKYYNLIAELKKQNWMTLRGIRILENYYKRNCDLYDIILP